MSAGQEAEELAEATLERMKLLLLALVPLAKQPRGVTGRLEPGGNGHLSGRQSLALAAGRTT